MWPIILVPDEDLSIQWYMSDGKPTGIESVTNRWIEKPVKPVAGFAPPKDSRPKDKP